MATQPGASGGFEPRADLADLAGPPGAWWGVLHPSDAPDFPQLAAPAPQLGWRTSGVDAGILDQESGEVLSSEELRGSFGSKRPRAGGFIGLNAVKFWFSEEGRSQKYGDADAIFEDVGTSGLRACYLRQTGFADLEWPGDTCTVDSEYSGGWSQLGGRQAALEALFSRLRDNGMRVVLTFLKVLSGAPYVGSSAVVPDPGDPLLDIAAGTAPWLNWGDPATSSLPSTLLVSEYPHPDDATSADWSIGQYLSWDGSTEGRIPTTGENTERWVWSTLDPRSPFKLGLVRQIAAAWVEVLEAARVAVGLASLSEVVEGIELCNEVDRKNVTVRPTPTGQLVPTTDAPWGWARLIAAGLAGFKDGFSAHPECQVRMFWPSLASYSLAPTGDGDTLDLSIGRLATLTFLTHLTTNTQVELRRYGLTTDELTNLDLHVYHYTAAAGGLQAGRFVNDLARLRARYNLLGGGDVTISAHETGVAAIDGSNAGEHLTEEYEWIRDLVSANDFSEVEHYQAWEVWRRLGTLMAGGARYAAWHTHVASASSTSEFLRTGLRADSSEDRSATVADATPRLSWWAYRRFADLLLPTGATLDDPSTGIIGAVLYPPMLGSVADRPERLAQGSIDGLVILQFHDASRSEFVYVLFLDPTVVFQAGERTEAAHLLVYCDGFSSESYITGTRCHLDPDDTSTIASGASFPAPSLAWTDEEILLNGGNLEVERDAEPLILRTPYRLEFWLMAGPEVEFPSGPPVYSLTAGQLGALR